MDNSSCDPSELEPASPGVGDPSKSPLASPLGSFVDFTRSNVCVGLVLVVVTKNTGAKLRKRIGAVGRELLDQV